MRNLIWLIAGAAAWLVAASVAPVNSTQAVAPDYSACPLSFVDCLRVEPANHSTKINPVQRP